MRDMREPLVRPAPFFALTFALSWAIWLPLAWLHFHPAAWPALEAASGGLRLLGVLMPATAALLLAGRAGGRQALRGLLGSLGHWRVGAAWWVAATLGQPALIIATGLLFNSLGGDPPVTRAVPLTLGVFIIQALFLLLATLGEEIGWRGLALPALQARLSPLAASVVLGLLWATWHLPFWLLLGNLEEFGAGYFALNYLLIVPTSLYITWFFNHSRGSLLLAVAFHITFNLVNVLWLPVTASVTAFAWLVAAEWVIGLALLPFLAKPSPSAARHRGATI